MINRLKTKLLSISDKRQPDFIVGGEYNPYLKRWFVIPRNPIFNIYLHQFLRSDDDRALHDHSYINFSWLLKGQYWEHSNLRFVDAKSKYTHIFNDAKYLNDVELFEDGNYRILRREGCTVFRKSGKFAHRIELEQDQTCWTLFITGPRYREWGFWCEQGWVHWHDFTDPDDKGGIGKGCD